MKLSTGWTLYGSAVFIVILSVVLYWQTSVDEHIPSAPQKVTVSQTQYPPIDWTGGLSEFTCSRISEGWWPAGILDSLVAPMQVQLAAARMNWERIGYKNAPKELVMPGLFVYEYCATSDGKYIVLSADKAPETFSRYDQKTGTLEVAKLYSTALPYVARGRTMNRGFGKRTGNTIGYEIADVPFGGFEKMSDQKVVLKAKNFTFCNNGLLSNGVRSDCSFDISYEYNFIDNIVREKKICTFYTDESGARKTLEGCRIF